MTLLTHTLACPFARSARLQMRAGDWAEHDVASVQPVWLWRMQTLSHASRSMTTELAVSLLMEFSMILPTMEPLLCACKGTNTFKLTSMWMEDLSLFDLCEYASFISHF